MPNLTIKKIPEPLYERLKERAKLNRRSMNSEVIACLERVLMPRRRTEAEFLRDADAHVARMAEAGFFAPEPEVLKAWIEEGRE